MRRCSLSLYFFFWVFAHAIINIVVIMVPSQHCLETLSILKMRASIDFSAKTDEIGKSYIDIADITSNNIANLDEFEANTIDCARCRQNLLTTKYLFTLLDDGEFDDEDLKENKGQNNWYRLTKIDEECLGSLFDIICGEFAARNNMVSHQFSLRGLQDLAPTMIQYIVPSDICALFESIGIDMFMTKVKTKDIMTADKAKYLWTYLFKVDIFVGPIIGTQASKQRKLKKKCCRIEHV